MNNNQPRGDAFSHLIYTILVREKRRTIREVAAAVGQDYATFHSRVIGRTHFKADEIARLLREVPDPRLFDYLMQNTPFVAVPRPLGTAKPALDVFESALQLARASLAILADVHAPSDGEDADDPARQDLSDRVREAERAISSLRANLLCLKESAERLVDAGAPEYLSHEAQADVSGELAAAD